MSPSRCAYCGDLAEVPASFNWVIAGEAGQRARTGRMPLCLACSRSWCVPEPVTSGVEFEVPLCENGDRTFVF